MTVFYQNKSIETAAKTLADLVRELNLDAAHTIFEFNGEIIPPGGNLERPLAEQNTLNAFHIVAGG